MPTISHFFGITIRMYFDDHGPPHFHAYYQEHHAIIDIKTANVRTGHLPGRAVALVLEWSEMHRDELMEDWRRAEAHEPLNAIAPLD